MGEELTFEAALSRLEQIVAELERGQLRLEESIEKFKEGVALAAECSKLLRAAELEVRVLTKRAEGDFALEPWAGIRPEEGFPSEGEQGPHDAGRED